jgi:hypothetical protein
MKTETILLLAGGAAAVWYFTQQSPASGAAAASPGTISVPVTVPNADGSTSTQNVNVPASAAGTTVQATVTDSTGQQSTISVPVPAANPAVADSSIPPAPATFDETYYLTYQYPAMLAYDPNVGNAKYVLTDPQATQYIANYLRLQNYPGDAQPLSSWKDGIGVQGVYRNPDTNNLINDKARLHWQLYGVANKYSYLPFQPYDNTPPGLYPPLPTTTPPKKSGSIFGDVLSGVEVATPIVLALAGTGSSPVLKERLDNREAGILITGGGIMMDVVKLFFGSPYDGQAREISNNFEDLIAQYVKP